MLYFIQKLSWSSNYSKVKSVSSYQINSALVIPAGALSRPEGLIPHIYFVFVPYQLIVSINKALKILNSLNHQKPH